MWQRSLRPATRLTCQWNFRCGFKCCCRLNPCFDVMGGFRAFWLTSSCRDFCKHILQWFQVFALTRGNFLGLRDEVIWFWRCSLKNCTLVLVEFIDWTVAFRRVLRDAADKVLWFAASQSLNWKTQVLSWACQTRCAYDRLFRKTYITKYIVRPR